MKKIIQLMLLIPLLCASSLFAEAHWGTGNKYKIGTSDDPVRVSEYVEFLNDISSTDYPWIVSDYYDSSFMVTDEDFFPNNYSRCIYRSKREGDSLYSYSVDSSRYKNDIIDAVYWVKVAHEFRDWRTNKRAAAPAQLAKNPTRQELCDYINAKIAGHLDASWLEKAGEIEKRYPEARGLLVSDIWFSEPHENSLMQTLWQQVDELVKHLYGYDKTDATVLFDGIGQLYTITTHYAASDEECNGFVGRWGMVFSKEDNTSLNFPEGMPKKVVLLDETKKDDKEFWAVEYPSTVQSDYKITLSDTAVVTKIPCTFPGSNNGNASTTGTQH